MNNGFVDLNRIFHEIPRQAMPRDDTDLSTSYFGYSSSTWEDLLKLDRVVILSEAGSGKTWELQQQARKLRADNKASFFLRLEHIADDFDIAFEVGDPTSFATWLQGSAEGWIFLDSVDEARLRGPFDVDRAIRRIGVRLDNARA